MKKALFPILALILVACVSSPEGAPAPQVTVAPEATSTSAPPPTETPLPTLTPTPVAVNGIAENAEGEKLAFLNGEWRVLPELDADYASMRVDENGGVVAVDAEGEVAFEYDMAAQNWVEVVREPSTIILANNDQMARYMEAIQMPENVVPILDANGNPISHGYLGRLLPGIGEYYSGVVVGHGDFSESGQVETYIIRMNLPNGTTLMIPGQLFKGTSTSSKNPILFVKDKFDPSVFPQGVEFSLNNTTKAQVAFMIEHAMGRQIIFRFNPSPESNVFVEQLKVFLQGGSDELNPPGKDVMVGLLQILMSDEGARP